MVRVRAKDLWTTAAVCLGVALLIQLIRPPRTNPPVDPSQTIGAHVPIPAAADAILHRACYDCHSNQTRWPWYSGVAPVSWFVISHVNGGREAMNFDDWSAHRSRRPDPPISEICAQVRKGAMPISNYLWMHADARLSDADKAVLCEWAGSVLQGKTPPAGDGR
jgi:hypothetical protein